MPYFIRTEGDKHCVVKGTEKEPGETMKCYPTRAAALAYLRALYVNVEDAKATVTDASENAPHGEGGTLSEGAESEDDTENCVCPKCGHKIKSEEGKTCSDHTCPQCGTKMGKAEAKNLKEFTVYKSGDVWRWLTVSNVAIEDREREVVSEKAYDDAISYAYGNNTFGELDLVHVDGTDVGTCDLMVRLGNQLIEGGEWGTDARSERVREKVQADLEHWGVSIKFKFDPEKFDGKVYKGGIRILKRTILPRQMAASYGTAIAVTGGTGMKKYDEETKAALSELGLSDDEIAALVEKSKALPAEENVAIKEEATDVGKPWYEDEGMEDAKSVWETSSVNDLPDSSFLFIESGGEKKDGKTEPRSLRHLPYKSADGKVDLPHLRNAISRLGQPATGKDWKGFNREALLKKAQSLLAGQGDGKEGKSIEAEVAEPEIVETKAPEGFWSSIKGEVQKVLDAFKKMDATPESETLTTDVSENSPEETKEAETEVVSEKTETQEPEKEPEAEKQFVTKELLQAYGKELAQTIVAAIAKEVADLKLEQEKAKDWRTAMEKEVARLAKPIEQRVMDRLAELPPIVKTRVSHLDATAKSDMPKKSLEQQLLADVTAEVTRNRATDKIEV